MSVIILTTITISSLPTGASLIGGALGAALAAAAASLKLRAEERERNRPPVPGRKSVELDLDNASEVGGELPPEQSVTFSRGDATVTFFRDAEGRVAVRVEGEKSEEELRALGEELANRVVQQYAYHRLVTEMKARNMNIVEEEVEDNGTVRLRVRVHQG